VPVSLHGAARPFDRGIMMNAVNDLRIGIDLGGTFVIYGLRGSKLVYLRG
jgi:hypothetical protein